MRPAIRHQIPSPRHHQKTLASGGPVAAGGRCYSSRVATLLFFDDFYLNRWQNLRRRIGQPELVPEATFSEPEFWLASGYP